MFRGELALVCLGDLVRESPSSDIVPDDSVCGLSSLIALSRPSHNDFSRAAGCEPLWCVSLCSLSLCLWSWHLLAALSLVLKLVVGTSESLEESSSCYVLRPCLCWITLSQNLIAFCTSLSSMYASRCWWGWRTGWWGCPYVRLNSSISCCRRCSSSSESLWCSSMLLLQLRVERPSFRRPRCSLLLMLLFISRGERYCSVYLSGVSSSFFESLDAYLVLLVSCHFWSVWLPCLWPSNSPGAPALSAIHILSNIFAISSFLLLNFSWWVCLMTWFRNLGLWKNTLASLSCCCLSRQSCRAKLDRKSFCLIYTESLYAFLGLDFLKLGNGRPACTFSFYMLWLRCFLMNWSCPIMSWIDFCSLYFLAYSWTS